jgi:phosphotransferase system  glucose/maltose/N-acetylglucosamine-specific IIC component
MGVLRQIAEYLYIKKRDPNQPRSQWLKYMHGINRISIFMFLFAIIVMLIRLVIIPFFSHH